MAVVFAEKCGMLQLKEKSPIGATNPDWAITLGVTSAWDVIRKRTAMPPVASIHPPAGEEGEIAIPGTVRPFPRTRRLVFANGGRRESHFKNTRHLNTS